MCFELLNIEDKKKFLIQSKIIGITNKLQQAPIYSNKTYYNLSPSYIPVLFGQEANNNKINRFTIIEEEIKSYIQKKEKIIFNF